MSSILSANNFFKRPNIFWQLDAAVNGYQNRLGDELSTQACAGRFFKVLNDQEKKSEEDLNVLRIKVILLEDGYICWFKLSEILDKVKTVKSWEPILLTKHEIYLRIDPVLNFVEKASKINNKYLWGGTLGPNYDCSGLVQASFASQSIWLPRDAYQQEKFCSPIRITLTNYENLKRGDLLFFGDQVQCDHVAIYHGSGCYWHSSGILHGRDGIGLDCLFASNDNKVSTYYRSRLRSAGRVIRCHDGNTLN
tara:strand:- start:60 stop:812 length:753 start_codon:yes stop_codon:yes gene_type:complete